MWVESTEEVEIEAPVAAVWALRYDFLRLSEYNPDVSGIERVGDARYRFMLATAHGPHEVMLEVTESVKDESVTAVIQGTLKAEETFTVVPLGDARSHATLCLRLELPAEFERAADAYRENGRQQIRGELDGMAQLLRT